MARPTKYNKEILEKAKEYLFKYEDLGQVIPTIDGLSLHLDIDDDTIVEWCKDDGKKEFSATVKAIKKTQKQVLINKGLDNKFNAKITQLLLGANHGTIEKVAQEVSGPGGGPVQTSTVINFIPVSRDGE